MWVVRADYPSGPVVEECATEAEAYAAQQRHLANNVSVAVLPPPGLAAPTRCSFCGKDRDAVRHLIAGPTGRGVAICDQCVALCNEILAGRPSTAPR
jgi:hypothetical protein